MDNIKTFENFQNEGILSFSLKYLNPRAMEVFNLMKKDFVKNNKNLRKIKIYSNGMIYYYDKNINAEIRVSTHNIDLKNFEIVFSTLKNYPSVKITEFESKMIISFFKKEYDKVYPQLKSSTFRNEDQIKQIENGEKPTIGYVDVFSLNGIECVFPLTDLKDQPKYIKWIKSNYAVRSKSLEGYPVVYCYQVNSDNEDKYKDIDPLGEENWDDADSERIRVIEWLNKTPKKDIINQSLKDINS